MILISLSSTLRPMISAKAEKSGRLPGTSMVTPAMCTGIIGQTATPDLFPDRAEDYHPIMDYATANGTAK